MKGRKISSGRIEGEALASDAEISFYGGVDADTGFVTDKGHPLDGQSVSGKILVFPTGKGSTVGSYTIYRLKKAGKAPLAIINRECDTVIAVGAIISGIPCVDKIDVSQIRTGNRLWVDADRGEVKIL